jgi:hypothetical protein
MAPMWDTRATLMQSPSCLNEIVQEDSRKASEVAKANLHEVTEAMNI